MHKYCPYGNILADHSQWTGYYVNVESFQVYIPSKVYSSINSNIELCIVFSCVVGLKISWVKMA